MHCGVQCFTTCSVGYSALQYAVWGTVHYNTQRGAPVCLYLDLIQKVSNFWIWGFIMKMCFETDMPVRYCPPSCLVIETPCFGNWFFLYDHGKVELSRWDLRFPQHKCWGLVVMLLLLSTAMQQILSPDDRDWTNIYFHVMTETTRFFFQRMTKMVPVSAFGWWQIWNWSLLLTVDRNNQFILSSDEKWIHVFIWWQKKNQFSKFCASTITVWQLTMFYVCSV